MQDNTSSKANDLIRCSPDLAFLIKKKWVHLPELFEQLGSFYATVPQPFNNSGGGLCGEVRPKIHGGPLEARFFFSSFAFGNATWVANSPSKCSWRIKFATERNIRQTHQKTTNGVAANRPVANPRSGRFLQWFMTSVFLVNMTYDVHRLKIAWDEFLNSELFFFTSFCCLKSL